jgi:hypothetical protein
MDGRVLRSQAPRIVEGPAQEGSRNNKGNGMNYLKDYTDKELKDAFDRAGAFWAFSNEQLAEVSKPGVEYVGLGAGLVCPKGAAAQLLADIDVITAAGREADLAENGREKVIIRELDNHECFYLSDPEDAFYALRPYGISREEVCAVFRKESSRRESNG